MTRNDTLAFLRCVLPAEGYFCAVVFDTPRPKPGVDRPRQRFFRSIEDLCDFILSCDQQGKTVYHACASFRTNSNRKQANVARARSLWLDIDCGAGKPYTDKETAGYAVVDFCRASCLPLPVFVDSGGGIHCYWPLDQDVDREQWQVYADGLKRLCVQHGLHADPAVTADVARILRTPGTHNRKNGESLVQASPHPCAKLDARTVSKFFSSVERATIRTHQRPDSPSGSILGRIESATSYASVRSDDVADKCAQLRAFRQSGDLPEPLWYACIGVLARTVDGDLKAHEWSQRDYPSYRADTVDERIHRSRLLSGATTCERLHALDPATCERCPFWGKINSPVSVPIDAGSIGRMQRTPINGFAHVPDTRLRPTVGGIELPSLKTPFSWGTGGKLVYSSEKGPNGDQVDVTIADFPVYLAAVQTGELELGRHSYKFCQHKPREGWQDVVIEAKLLFGAGGGAELADRGVVLHDHKCFLNYVRQAVTDFHETEETHVRYDQFGWKSDNTSFLYGQHLYTAAGPVSAIGAKEVATRSQWIGPRKGGHLETWTEAADALFAKDMEAYSAMVLASFAAPLMRFQSADEGGAILHLFTRGSGQGKTTALTGAWTVWGTKEGLSLTNDDTRVAKPIAIGTLANLPVIYDELRDRDPEVIRRMVVMFTEGRDRLRGTVDGGLRHTKANWQTILLSAANDSLLDQLQGDGTDAPAFRVLELSSELPPSIDKTKGDRLKRIMNENAGHAGDAFLRYLVQPEVLAFTREALEKWTEEIWRYSGLDSPHRFRVRAVGAIAVAAKIVEKLDLLHFNTDRIIEWLCQQISSDIMKGTVSAAKPNAEIAAAQFGNFINAHLGEILVVPDRFKPRSQVMVPIRSPVNRLSIRYEIAPGRVFISETVFREWAGKNELSARHVLEVLEKSQVIVARKRMITLSAGTNIPGAQVPCIEVNAQHPIMSGLVSSVEELQLPHRAEAR